ncbi:MAG: DnaJ C-terminal domain-containing protein [Pseudoxanthomonas suwonensis]|nr:DnaJ C-terminal domain-containing protein [Pseudoxanthomonas suwonensis]
MQFKDYYQTLGVDARAGDAEIKTAYRRLARKYHPDVSKETGAEDRFKEVNEAYEALRDPQRRQAYDQMRARGYRPGDEVPPSGQGWQAPSGGIDGYEDIFADGGAGGGFSDFFEQMFGRRAGFRQRGAGARPAGSDTRARLAVPLEAVYRGDAARINVAGKALEVKIPADVRAGQSIRLKGQGNHGGDLLLQIEYAAHPHFEVDGRNIIHVLPVAPWEAALGATVSVPTLGGAVEVKVPPGSEAGRRLRLRGRGLPMGSSGAGDQIVELEVLAPRPETDAQREAYASLRRAFDKDWRRA